MAPLPPRPIIRLAWKTHRALVRWSGGRFGLRSSSANQEGLAQLTTTGRRSGQKRTVMIAYLMDGDDFVTMAMNGWDEADPAWWLNMQANPTAELITPDGTITVVGRAANAGDEHDRLWNAWRDLDKFVDQHSHRRNHTPVVILSPA